MKNNLIILSLAILVFSSCSKEEIEKQDSDISSKKETEAVSKRYVQYTISKGQQYCDKSIFAAVKTSQLSFKVKFDSSAIYKTIAESNQTDINKLFGFSDNNATHHEYSARFGWRWSDNALRIFAYDYNNSVISFKELGIVQIGTENNCSIKVSGNQYIFSLNGKETAMPRSSTTALAEGYKLFPYFGGDESAPHAISIWIEEL
ncbi:MAG: hypothetical protein ACTHK0_00375 [Ginsengibacter sp.]